MDNNNMLPLLPVTETHIHLSRAKYFPLLSQIKINIYKVCAAAVTAKTVTTEIAIPGDGSATQVNPRMLKI